MDDAAAKALAVRRWGKEALAKFDPKLPAPVQYRVGFEVKRDVGHNFVVKGAGESWEAAFAEAKRARIRDRGKIRRPVPEKDDAELRD